MLFQYFFVPGTLAFAFVGTTLLTMACAISLVRQDKHKFYNAESLIMVTPTALMAWVEGLTCDVFLMQIGGHLWYDLIIPISITAYFFYIRNQQVSEAESKVKAE